MVSPPQKSDRSIAEIPGTGYHPDLGVFDLGSSGGSPQLLHGLNNVMDAPAMTLTQKPAMGIAGQFAAQFDVAVGNKISRLFEGNLHQGRDLHIENIGEAVIDLRKIKIVGGNPCHLVSPRKAHLCPVSR